MTENFLISDSLKSSLSKETLYENTVDNMKTVPIVHELRITKDYVELDVSLSDAGLSKYISTDKIVFNENLIDLNCILKFRVARIFFNKAKSMLYTIVICEQKFWSSL